MTVESYRAGWMDGQREIINAIQALTPSQPISSPSVPDAATARQYWPGQLVESVIEEFSTTHGVSVNDLKSPARHRAVSHPRQDLMLVMRNETGMKLTEIGQALGGRDHTTVLYGVARARERAALMEEVQ
jgi:chromosomal replication initiation ATPase DnaA